jgi:DNA uptake protein ComE-like DNA-binding protein
VAVVAVMLVSIQIASFRQAASGREALARVRAHWAARAGIETVIAKVQGQTRTASPVSTVALLSSIAAEPEGTVGDATWRVEHTDDNGTLQPGVFDPHTRINVNLMTADDLMLLPDMTEEVSQAIVDYVDADEDARPSGAEAETYGTLEHSYKPRNAPIRSLAELDLVYGVQPGYVRGADTDLNGIVTNRERTGGDASARTASVAESGWSAYLTASSSTTGLTPLGEPRVDLTATDAGTLQGLLGVNTTQADAIIAAARASGATIETFLRSSLTDLATAAAQANGQQIPANRRPPDLTRDQLILLYDSCSIGPATSTKPGKLNINTCSRDILDYFATLDRTLADEIIEYRDRTSGEMTSIVELLDIPGLSRAQLASLAARFDVASTVFIATSRGRDPGTGIEVEMIAEIDRSTMPVTIRSLRVR